MTRCNPDNERIKRRYFRHLSEAEGLTEKTVDHARRTIVDYEQFTDWQDFRRFHSDTAIAFKKRLLTASGKRSAAVNQRSTIHSKLLHLEKFFTWLAEQPGFRTAFSHVDADYFKLPRRDRSIALDRQVKPAPSVEQMHLVIGAMPALSDVELRNRALVSCLLLTGARVGAVRSLKLKHVLRNKTGIHQDAREVRTKGAKTFPTYFFPVGGEARNVFLSYVDHLRLSLGWGEDDPLFPSTRQDVGDDHQFSVVGLERRHWKTADPVRAIFRAAFDVAGLPRYSPHSIRRTLVGLGQEVCRTPQEYKAWSQNLGHNEVLTTFISYGGVSDLRQAEILNELGSRRPDIPADMMELAARLIERLQKPNNQGVNEGSTS